MKGFQNENVSPAQAAVLGGESNNETLPSNLFLTARCITSFFLPANGYPHTSGDRARTTADIR